MQRIARLPHPAISIFKPTLIQPNLLYRPYIKVLPNTINQPAAFCGLPLKKLALAVIMAFITLPNALGQTLHRTSQQINVAAKTPVTSALKTVDKQDSLAYLYRTLLATSAGVPYAVLHARDNEARITIRQHLQCNDNIEGVLPDIGLQYTRPIKITVQSTYAPSITNAVQVFASSLEQTYNSKVALPPQQVQRQYRQTPSTNKESLTQQYRQRHFTYIDNMTQHLDLSKSQVYPIFNALSSHCELITLKWQVHIDPKASTQRITLIVAPAPTNWREIIGGLRPRPAEKRI